MKKPNEVDYISDVLGIEKHDVIHIINLLHERKSWRI